MAVRIPSRHRATALYSAAIVLLLLGLSLRCFVFLQVGPGTVIIFAAFFGAAALVHKARNYSGHA